MKIIELNIIQFGKFKNVVFNFEDGFNIVKGDNESGKSTLLAFIKFALYGVGRKNPNILVGERERAISWDTGIAAGSLTLEDVDGKKYRIERSGREGARGTYVDRARIIDLESGAEVFEGEVPGEHFLGINAQAYDSMCNIRQLEAVAIGSEAVKGAIDNLLSSGDENISVQVALKMLDAERRRLMHTNGRGGVVVESETVLERLKSEYRNSLIHENESIKNTDELERVEIGLAKAQEEHKNAQKLCDLYDDVLRLQKFNELRELEEKNLAIENDVREFDKNAGFDGANASYERVAQMNGVAEAVTRSRASLQNAEKEFNDAQNDVESFDITNKEGMSALLDEFSSPRVAGAYYKSKAKKAKNMLIGSVVFAALGIGLLTFAIIVALAMSNPAGAMTVGFIALLSLAGASLFYKSFASAKADKKAFEDKLGGTLGVINASEIERVLEKFSRSKGEAVRNQTSLDNAKIRLSASQENYRAECERARAIISHLGLAYNEGNEAEILLSEAQKMKDYLAKRQELEQILRDGNALCKSLRLELERYNEADIRARITPEIEEKIMSVSFDRLKAERDAALHKTNQFGQYKAGIERNLASNVQRRNSNEIFPEIEAEQSRLDSLKLRLEAVRLAMETVNAASLSLKSDITPRIRERAQNNLSSVTNGKYSELFVDQNMKLSVFVDGATRPVEALSKGSLDAAYFSLRLALVQTLLADKKPPIYMDECLSQLDDGRAENVLRTVAEHSRDAQCILFTCQNRDVNLAERIVDVNVIEI